MDLGQEGERLARRYLEQQGLTFVEQNVRYSFGELDLVMKQGIQWVFVEVKYRSPSRFGGALQSLSQAQITRLRKAASQYLQQHRINAPCRFDLLAIDAGKVQWLQDAF
ncbi:YraN family protein [Shewanella algae]|uniref:YraN family protein n=1 Tax=Shewanella algae TaxID=38313 RepID=UPI001F406DC9|nr:YraN family protein [Shewanella algae]MCE9782863.1 YraN family protein [Shewanella algae]